MKIIALAFSRADQRIRIPLDYLSSLLSEAFPALTRDFLTLPREEDSSFFPQLVSALSDAPLLLLSTPVFQDSLPAALEAFLQDLPQGALQGMALGIMVTGKNVWHLHKVAKTLVSLAEDRGARILRPLILLESKDYPLNTPLAEDILTELDLLAEAAEAYLLAYDR